MAQLGICYNGGFLSTLTKLFTGSTAYHVLWKTDDFCYDMYLLRRRRSLSGIKNKEIIYYNFPKVTQEYLENQLTNDKSHYGIIDYILFVVRPVFHMFGKTTRNASGVICSEMINIDLINCGYSTLWGVQDPPPSPADLEKWLSLEDIGR